MSKIHLTNVYGKSVKFTTRGIKAALERGVPEMRGEAHVWAHDPIMVGIFKTRETKKGPFTYTVVEVDENIKKMLDDIFILEFTEDQLSEAVTLFMKLCENPKKKLQRDFIKKVGGSVIVLTRADNKSTEKDDN